MKIYTLLRLCLLNWINALTINTGSHDINKEAHTIHKRFAESGHGFSHHEVAHVLHEKGPNSFHRISKRDLRSVTEITHSHRLRIERASGSPMHLTLRKTSLFDDDSQFHDHTKHGLVKRSQAPSDCYHTGELELDDTAGGMVSVALCDGLHGAAEIGGVEYYIHPVENGEGEHMVHILSRRGTGYNHVGIDADEIYNDTLPLPDGMVYKREVNRAQMLTGNRYKREVNAETYKTATSFVIEMAVFVDAKYYEIIHSRVPGREDEYILVGLAAANAIYSEKEKVGYSATIKVKQYVTWVINPEEYVFEQNLQLNLASFCRYTRDKYAYDMHFLHTGVTNQGGPAVGVAYTSGVCTSQRCVNILTTGINRWTTIAHEIGHNLGFDHEEAAKCPNKLKNRGDGFMGKGSANFSPCNKWELFDFFSRGKGQCLFEETGIVETPDNYVNIPRLFPGQSMSPDEQCRVFYGEEYEFYRPFKLSGDGECQVFLCLNRNKASPEYLKIVAAYAVRGFTCGDEMFCTTKMKCESWYNPNASWDRDYLRAMKKENTWSEWTEEWSECSRDCGTGVQIKRRRCQVDTNVFLTPFCKGESIQSRLCNDNPCPGDPTSVDDLRKARGSEVCSRFLENNVKLKSELPYLPKPGKITIRDSSGQFYKGRSSCLLVCERKPEKGGLIDGIFPDGTPCTDSEKRIELINRYNINLRCVQGVCTEMTDCPNNAKKDTCGVCGGDPVNCVSKLIDSSYNVPKGQTATIAILPAGTSRIDLKMKWQNNKKVKLEVWNAEGEMILGNGALFKSTKYTDANPVEYAGTKWTFDHAGYIRADGPTDQEMILKASRKSKPIKEMFLDYLLPSQGF